MEIYCERIRCLLSGGAPGRDNLQVKTDKVRGVFVEGGQLPVVGMRMPRPQAVPGQRSEQQGTQHDMGLGDLLLCAALAAAAAQSEWRLPWVLEGAGCTCKGPGRQQKAAPGGRLLGPERQQQYCQTLPFMAPSPQQQARTRLRSLVRMSWCR